MKIQDIPIEEIKELASRIEHVLEKRKEGVAIGALAFLVSKWMITLVDKEDKDQEDLIEEVVELIEWFCEGWKRKH
jgi:predicted site-specific integrase-resolvase